MKLRIEVKNPIQIGILQVDSVRPEYRARHGDYPDMFTELLSGADAAVSTRIYDVVNGDYPGDIDECAGYLITGSRDSVYDDLPWLPELIEFVGELLTRRVKLVGICFGHQLIAHYFGGKVTKANQGWAVGVHRSQVLPPVEGQQRPYWLDEQAASIAILSSHKDQFVKLPDGARLYATNDFCPNAGFVIGDSVLTIQGHPEFSKSYSQALMEHRRALLGERTYSEGIASLEQTVEGERMGRWLVDFFRGPHVPRAA